MMALSKQLPEIEQKALRLLSQSNFHRCLYLPATATHDRLRVTYAVSSNFEDEALPVILYCGGMFCSRYHAMGMDHIATEKGVRLIHVDRPGFGGSSPIAPKDRLSHWLELVPVLLTLLAVTNVHLVSHSAGTLYLLNTLYNRHDLFPSGMIAPYAALMTPWVHSEHSQASLMSFVNRLPSGIINAWNPVLRFVSGKVLPTIGASGTVLTASSGFFEGLRGAKETQTEEGVGLVGPDQRSGRPDKELVKELGNAQMRFILMEETDGVNDEALVLLRKNGLTWGSCDDYREYPRRLLNVEEARTVHGNSYPPLKLHAYFAESDVMIGAGGQKYFVDCWRQALGTGSAISFESFELAGTDHESIVMDESRGALGSIFDEVVRQSRTSSRTEIAI